MFIAAWASSFLLMVSLSFGKSQITQEWSGFYPESYAREVAVDTVMPVYPHDAIQRGITGVVQAKIAIDESRRSGTD